MRTYPYTIENGQGEQLTFTGVSHGPDGDRAEADALPNLVLALRCRCTISRRRPPAW